MEKKTILQKYSIWIIQIQKFLSRSHSFFQSKINETPKLSNHEKRANLPNLNQRVEEDDSLCREDVEVVMGKIGFFCNPENENDDLEEKIGVNELSKLFKEKEASLEEVQEAFYVFDENRDGFIDAEELQRILWCVLGFREETEIENCRKMIKAFDENSDGKIDFDEFVMFMENSLC